MRTKHQKTLDSIFEGKAGIRWADIVSLVEHVNGAVSESKGSRVRFLLNDVRGVFHRPHPSPETNKATVKDIRRFLTEAGVKP